MSVVALILEQADLQEEIYEMNEWVGLYVWACVRGFVSMTENLERNCLILQKYINISSGFSLFGDNILFEYPVHYHSGLSRSIFINQSIQGKEVFFFLFLFSFSPPFFFHIPTLFNCSFY